jgi:hypothetical protein
MSVSECFEIWPDITVLRRKCVEPKRRKRHGFLPAGVHLAAAIKYGPAQTGACLYEFEYACILQLHA